MRKILLFVFCLVVFTISAQDSLTVKKQNPIIYGEFTIGGAFLKGGCLYLDGGLNYQKEKHLFKLKFAETIKFETDLVSAFIPLPYFTTTNKTQTFSVLYGQRYINGGFSYSYAGGISLVKSKKLLTQDIRNAQNLEYVKSTYIGFPLEFTIRWFKKKKKRYRILYGIIPVGKPTSFGRSIGFKLYANISKKTYFGLGLTLGLGNHKIYN